MKHLVLKYLAQLLNSLLVFVLRRHVDFCHYYKERDFQEEAESYMLLSHLLETHIRANHHTPVVRVQTCQPVDGSL